MRRKVVAPLFCVFVSLQFGQAIPAPTGLISIAGDKSVVLHWDRVSDPTLSGYHVYRSTSGAIGPFSLAGAGVLTGPGFCDISGSVLNGRTNFYFVRTVATNSVESAPSQTNAALPHVFVNDDEFLDYVQQTCFFYFWYAANPTNGLVPDRSAPGSACSIAAVGFGLTAIGIAADHRWITRTQAVARVLTTLNTFWQGPQGPATTGVIGYNGWFYHFLDMNTALRAGSELSSIDTCLLLAGILYAKQYFNGPGASEAAIRSLADAIFNRVNWTFMSQGTDAVRMGWDPATGFQNYGNWVGYNEGMIIYLLGLGTATNPLPASSWSTWTSGYTYGTFYGQTYVPFPSLFGHEYSHCWIDFRSIADTYMNSKNLTYFENSRRAALAEVAYCGAAPHVGYSTNVWGLTACDGPQPTGYAARGLPPAPDDGTIAPTAAGGAICFAPEYCLATLQYFYSHFRINIWTEYGYRDAFNIGQGWYDTDELGIDQGPIVIMIENYRTQNIWNLFMLNPEIQRGLQRAGFVQLPFMALSPQSIPSQGTFSLSWTASANRYYQVEYSPDLFNWFFVPGFVQATNGGPFTWFDTGPPVTASLPVATPSRFFRVFQLGGP